MNEEQLTQLIAGIPFTLLIASLVGAASYVFWRGIESVPYFTAIAATLAILPGVQISVLLCLQSKSFLTLVLYLIVAGFFWAGSCFHSKSRTSKWDIDLSFATLYASIISSLIFGGLLLFVAVAALPVSSPLFSHLYFGCCAISPSLTSILFYVLKNTKLRSRTNKHRDD